MPVHLGPYQSPIGPSAENPVAKFHRAIDSLWKQTLMNWELLIVVDGCAIAEREVSRYVGSQRIRVFSLPKQRQWSPVCRNHGLAHAAGAYAIYLDSDDTLGPDHLLTIAHALKAGNWPRWAAMDDTVWNTREERWETRLVEPLLKAKKAGTSNFTHRLDIGVIWPEPKYNYPEHGYAQDDRSMVRALSNDSEPLVIRGAQYFVQHIPGQYDL